MNILKTMDEMDYFSSIDRHFARFITTLSVEPDPVIGLSAALVSRNNREGDVCIDLNTFAGLTLASESDEKKTLTCPLLSIWREHLQDSDLVGRPGQYFPLIWDDADRIYLYRYWDYEKQLIDLIQSKSRQDDGNIDIAKLKQHLDRLFPATEVSGIDWQKMAAVVAVAKRFCVISGGPGTGKTYAIARILATLIEQYDPDNLRIFLTAPTGKAAARLSESIGLAKKQLMCDPKTLLAIPEAGTTIHRLLKPIKDSPYFIHNRENRLPADVVVVDEASMVDLPLMSKLIQALPEMARLILIGDRHQLASVQAGSVLGDICGDKIDNGFSKTFARTAAAAVNCSPESLVGPHKGKKGIQDSMVYFTRPYRFAKDSGINVLSRAVNKGAIDDVLDILKQARYPEIVWHPVSNDADYHEMLSESIQVHYGKLGSINDPQKALEELNRFRILCAVNQGRLGVETLNALATAVLAGHEKKRFFGGVRSEWYHGRPILITANDYGLGLFNGDVGIAMMGEVEEEKMCHVYFQSGPSRETQRFSTSRLSHHQAVYAMTVHKSQGSEFDEVLLVLPEKDNPLLTRELLYTAITRARQKLSILASDSVIRNAVSRRIERASGLRDALWQ
jgi:exodeoxyribonuclease V alpha subunit